VVEPTPQPREEIWTQPGKIIGKLLTTTTALPAQLVTTGGAFIEESMRFFTARAARRHVYL
jgi:hypothetical protein